MLKGRQYFKNLRSKPHSLEDRKIYKYKDVENKGWKMQ